MGYKNIKEERIHSPNVDPFYFCSVCGAWNNPFYSKDFETLKKKNVCKRCQKEDKDRTLYNRRIGEKTQ
jgi:formylmethanofuran dehydrogenase subunit E